MRFHWGTKDGGPESHVYMYGVESKRFGSLLALRFEDGSREAFHSHAFNCISLVVTGCLLEQWLVGTYPTSTLMMPAHTAGKVIRTYVDTFHQVFSLGRTWVLTLRGPWRSSWQEYLPAEDRYVTLTHGRKEAA
jgi:hypothetical protein